VTKNRFGPTDEVGVFKMEEKGLREVKSEEINLVEGDKEKVGSAITVVMEGTRPMMVEIQALVTESFAPMPKRVFSGIDYNRGQLLTAVVQKSLGVDLYKYDVYVSVTGGIKVDDTGADLAVVAAMYSSYKDKPLPKTAVYVGEVSLLGEVKKIRGMEKREKEAKNMGRGVVYINSIRELKK
jgi:DNA repair protein RadA/Sms